MLAGALLRTRTLGWAGIVALAVLLLLLLGRVLTGLTLRARAAIVAPFGAAVLTLVVARRLGGAVGALGLVGALRPRGLCLRSLVAVGRCAAVEITDLEVLVLRPMGRCGRGRGP